MDTGASTSFEECVVASGEGAGLLAGAASHGSFRQCRFVSNHGPGVKIEPGADPTFVSCVISENIEGVAADGKGSFLDCDISDNEGSGMVVTGNPELFKCRICKNSGTGVVKLASSHVTMEKCETSLNRY